MSETCPIRGVFCPEHGFVHGQEAQELRRGIEKVVARHHEDTDDLESALLRLLDNVDARDSLAFLESKDGDGGK